MFWDTLLDYLFPDIMVFVTAIYIVIMMSYITKKRFIGKCSLGRNIIHIVLSVIISPFTIIVLPLLTLGYVVRPYLTVSKMFGLSIDESFYVVWCFFYVVSLLIAVLIYVNYLKRKNVIMVVFLYLMFYVLTVFTCSIDLIVSEFARSIEISLSLLFCMICVLFHHYLVVPILRLKDEDNPKQAVFVLFPMISTIFVIMLLGALVYLELSEGVMIFSIIIMAFIELLLIVAFHSLIENVCRLNEVKTLSMEVMEALAHTIDAKDEYTRGHSVRVAKYSKMIAERLGLSADDCENVYYMALLHDIGKIGVPNEIINSTSKLTDDEYAVIKTHPGVGYDILAEIKSRPDLSIGARWHHERFDGKGYPDGKKGEEIPFFARIIAVADSYDAMTSNRSYRDYMPQAKVRLEIEKNMGTQFDPDIAKCMLEIIDEDVNYKLHE